MWRRSCAGEANFPDSVVVSRTDSIGDVVLTLPVCGAIKRASPQTRVIFLCSSYTAPVVRACRWVDEICLWPGPLPAAAAIVHVFPRPQIARAARHIPIRIGTYSRGYHWWTCNRLVRLHRKNSSLHEIELNLALLQPLLSSAPAFDWEMYGLEATGELPDDFAVEWADYAAGRPTVLLHPKSKGSAREWPSARWVELAAGFQTAGYAPVVTGTEEEKKAFVNEVGNDFFFAAGRMDLRAFMRLISESEGVVAASTGPLHLAAALGRKAVGIYPPIRPMHPGRWGPRGPHAAVVVADKDCHACRRACYCACIAGIPASDVLVAWHALA